MKKRIKKNMIVFTMIFSILSSYIAPISKVLALDTFEVELTIKVADSSDVTLTARDENGPVNNNVTGDGLVAFRGEGEHIIGFDDTYTNTGFANSDVSIICSNDKTCVATIIVPNDHGVKVSVGGGTPFKFTIEGHDYDNSPLETGTIIEIINDDNETQEFKKIYSYIRRDMESHIKNKTNLEHKIAESIWRRNTNYKFLYEDLTNLINNQQTLLGNKPTGFCSGGRYET